MAQGLYACTAGFKQTNRRLPRRLRAKAVYSIRIGRYGGGVGKRFHCFHHMIIHVIKPRKNRDKETTIMFTVLQMSGFQKYIVNREGDEFLTYISYFKNRLVGNL